MSEQEAEEAWEAQELFFERVRDAYREFKKGLSEEQKDYVFDGMQHVVNLYNPYIAS